MPKNKEIGNRDAKKNQEIGNSDARKSGNWKQKCQKNQEINGVTY